jgi:extradiol dioxygenase
MIRNLSYIGFTSPAADQWRTFGPDILGAQLAPQGPDGEIRLRVDDQGWRIAIHPGETDDLAYLGWDVADDAKLEAAIAHTEQAGINVHHDPKLAGTRGVDRLAWFVDPFGFRHELTCGAHQSASFVAGRPISGFVTGEQGLGHAVLIVPDLPAAETFYADVLGFVPSDSIESGVSLRFFHCPGHAARHHTIALAGVAGMVGIHHLMLEVADLDDVGTAYDLVNERELTVVMSLGRHTNDHMTSFYVRTPSGFEIEYGTGGRLIDDDTWQTGSYTAQSRWGHKPPAAGPVLPAIIRPSQPAGAAA